MIVGALWFRLGLLSIRILCLLKSDKKLRRVKIAPIFFSKFFVLNLQKKRFFSKFKIKKFKQKIKNRNRHITTKLIF